MKRERDKYGRGSAEANGAGFVDLEPGDTFAGLEAKLRLAQAAVYVNAIEALEINKSTDSAPPPNEGDSPLPI